MPGTTVATGVLADKGAGATEGVTLVDAVLVVDVWVNVDVPNAVAIDVPALFV